MWKDTGAAVSSLGATTTMQIIKEAIFKIGVVVLGQLVGGEGASARAMVEASQPQIAGQRLAIKCLEDNQLKHHGGGMCGTWMCDMALCC